MRLQTIKIIWADGGYFGAELFDWVASQFECQLEVVKKKKGVKG
ncbi:transposase [Thiocystis violacea]|nr:transposase [Thiocystis violacea]